jgi:hypothetical protein
VGFTGGRRLASYRFSSAVGGLEPYYLAVAGGDRIAGGWTRLVGLEQRATLSGLALVGLPTIELSGGVGYPLTGPDRHHARFYAAVGVRP